MSFMFSPCSYDDPHAVNRLALDDSTVGSVAAGPQQVAAAVTHEVASVLRKLGRCVLSIDGYTAAQLGVFLDLVERSLRETAAITIASTQGLFKPSEELERLLAENLPEDRRMDPVLLYGKIYQGGYEGLMDEAKLREMIGSLEAFRASGEGLLILCGYGSLIESLRGLSDIRCWVDIIPKRSILNIRSGSYSNIGDSAIRQFKQVMRRCYYVDFECAQRTRREALASSALDLYIAGDSLDNLTLVPCAAFRTILHSLARQPLRCRPVYLKGVWGGHFLTRMRDLPESIDNCAWCFDFIPMEVSIVAEFSGKFLELPFYTLLQAEGETIMGKACLDAFHGYFPIRFNYDDTWHSSGNMSIQVHPDEAYVVGHNNELGRQDESYYIVEAAQDAKTYLGFRDGVEAQKFLADVFRSEKEHTTIDYDGYINAVPSRPGMQLMIPAGTIHASGRNQLVLEIGSLTVGSYTYKMYDYLRTDLDGSQRPIHSKHAANVIRKERDATWVAQNIVQEPSVLRSGESFVERKVGEHDLLYFSLRTVSFSSGYADDTAGKFHVLTLVNGEEVRIESMQDPERQYTLSYLDIVLVPASIGAYRVVNLGNQPATIHKTLLKDDIMPAGNGFGQEVSGRAQ